MTRKIEQIKFRFWDFNAVMKYSSDCVNMIDFFYYYESALNGGNKPRLMQWTGLKDADGKDIYEGDIVEYDYSPDVAIVFYDDEDGSFGITGDVSWIDLFYGKRRWYNLRVVGNIYKNPELMES